MILFEDEEIVATGNDGKEIRITYKNVKNLQPYIGLHTVAAGPTSMAGPTKEWVKIETFDGKSWEIPRAPGNDTEILSFLLKWKRTPPLG